MKERLRVAIRGAVQGVGFRPFVYRLASEMGLSGWVENSAQGVFIEVEGEREVLQKFRTRLRAEKPPRSFIQSIESSFLDSVGYQRFEIRQSRDNDVKTALVMPDIATCPDCLREIFDSTDRRYRYPFTNCTNCGPRYSIIEGLPYDRAGTTMKKFVMCDNCQHEYENPLDRRFHAQPNACANCGPRLYLWDTTGNVLYEKDEALLAACDSIRAGKIVAIKGLGGFHLMVDARNGDAIAQLRHLKAREEKPFAMMLPSLDSIEKYCHVDEVERGLLQSPESPIVLLRRFEDSSNDISESIAPRNPYWGVMLPYTPLHHLLMNELGFPIVATSGNRSDEPIATDENEALERLAGIANLFLIHNRPIARHVDDSIVRVMAGRELITRRARGYAPLPIFLREEMPAVLAVGAHLKNAVAIAVENQAIISQHIGDLETAEAYGAFENAIASLSGVYGHMPEAVACDLHPDYLSTKYAQKMGIPLISVQHHYAHILSCMAENQIAAPAFGISWDGTGFGLDGTVWGGEFLSITENSFGRFGHLRTFRLPGGDAAISEPRRAALGLLYEVFGDSLFEMMELPCVSSFSRSKLRAIAKMLQSNLNSPVTSSAGRLFDAVSSIVGLRQITRYEGQAAMELEFALDGITTNDSYPFDFKEVGNIQIVNWEPMIRLIMKEKATRSMGLISAKFHNTLAEIMVEMAKLVGDQQVVLSGGCFQNKYLTERAVKRLTDSGFRPYWHQRIPPNDGGIALGQILAAARMGKKER